MSEAESSSTYRRGLLIDSEIRILTDFNPTFQIFSTSKQKSQGQLFQSYGIKRWIRFSCFLPTQDLIFIFFRVRKCCRSLTLSFISSPRWGGFLLRTPHRAHDLCLGWSQIIFLLCSNHGSPGRWDRGETQCAEHVAALSAGPLPRDEGELGAAHVAGHGWGRALVPLWAPLIVRAPTAHASWSRLGKR